MGMMKMKDGLKFAAMECGGPFMLEVTGILMTLPLSASSLDIRSIQVSFKSVEHTDAVPPLSCVYIVNLCMWL